jgi:hypothetical protein
MYDVKTLSIMKVTNSKHAKSTWIFKVKLYILIYSAWYYCEKSEKKNIYIYIYYICLKINTTGI